MNRLIIKELRLLGETAGVPNFWSANWREFIKTFLASDGFFMELHPTGKNVVVSRLDADPNNPRDPRREVVGISTANAVWVKMPDEEIRHPLPPKQYLTPDAPVAPPVAPAEPTAPVVVPAKPGRKPGGKNG